jgi:hypothetical protein
VQFTANGTGKQFVIGMNGTGTQLDIGNSAASDWNPHNGIGGYNGITGWRMDSSGNVYNFISTRSPIFYDTNDTGYYVDPTGTSITNVMRGDKYHSLYIGGQPSPRWDCSFYVLQSQHWYSHNGASTMYVGESGDFVYIRGYTQAEGSSRSPIFYDSNDTGYYLDPNTTGLSLRVNGNIECYARSAAWAEGYRVRVPSRATWGGIRFTRDEGNSNGNWAIGFTGIDSTDDLTFWGNLNGGEGMRARLTQGGVFSVAGDVRAPIFYDSNNTSFYIDPAGGSLINEIYNYGWYRSYGDAGWFSQSYGGGIFMQDTTWVRVYNGKAFYVPNDIASAGNVTAYYSDERLKTKTGGIDNALEKVVGLSGFIYVENDLARSLGYTNEKQQVGVSAQAVQAVLPEAVSLAPVDFETLEDGTITSKSGENYLTVDYSRLVPLLIEAIKELSLKVKTLEEKDN